MTPENWRAYLFIIVLMAKRARAEQRGQGGKGGAGAPPPWPRSSAGIFFHFKGFVCFHAPRGRGGGQRAVRPGTSRAKAKGRDRAGAKRGAGGGGGTIVLMVGMS